MTDAQLSAVALPHTGEAKKRDAEKLGRVFWIAVGWIALTFLLAIFANLLWFIQDPNYQNFDAINAAPSFGHWLGCDDLGRDIFARIIYGSRVSLIVGFGAMAIGITLGGSLGMISAYRRGWVDTVLSAVLYIFLAFPALVLVIAIVAFWGSELWKITLVLGFASTPILYRVIRASTLSYAQRDFVVAAQTLGATDRRVLTKELLPNVFPTLVSFSLIGVATVIITEGALSFLGLSVESPTPSWGNMLNESRTYLDQNPWLVLFPSLAMFCFLLAINLVADKLRARLDVTEGKL